MSLAVFRNSRSRLRTKRTARSMSACSVSGSYQVRASAGRSDQGPDAAYGSLIHARSRGWSSLCQALGHLARARSASASSRAAISPATKDRRPDPA